MVKGRGTVATGRVEQGIVKVGDEVEVLGLMQVCLLRHFLIFLGVGLPSFLLIKMPIADLFCFYIYILYLQLVIRWALVYCSVSEILANYLCCSGGS